MAKSFIKKHQDLVKSCTGILESTKGLYVFPENDQPSISWCDCDGNYMFGTAYAIDKEYVYAAEDGEDIPPCADIVDFIEECYSVCFNELSTESLCRMADIMCKQN